MDLRPPHFATPAVRPIVNRPPTPPLWTIGDALATYGVDSWAKGFFGVSPQGEVEVYLEQEGERVALSLLEIVNEAQRDGLHAPLLLRFPDLLAARLERLNASFHNAMRRCQYRGRYRGVYPTKVNQQRQVIEQITRCGRRYHFGLEVGSKPELLAALAYLRDPQALLVCNGYKDRQFIDLALSAQQLGMQVILVLEMPGELDLVLERAALRGVTPTLGVRAKLATRHEGRWSRSSGEGSVFGLNTDQILAVVDRLKAAGKLDCLRMLHYHQGSQVPDIGAVRDAAMEASRIYVELAREGASMGFLDIGGGLAVDYDGSHSNTPSSRNYGTLEYASDVVEAVMTVCDEAGQPHPDIVSESGRALTAYYSVLIFNVLEVNRFCAPPAPQTFSGTPHRFLESLRSVAARLTDENTQECYNDAVYYRGELLALFNHGQISLRERAHADHLFRGILSRIQSRLKDLPKGPDSLDPLPDLHDVYYGNFSIFQSLPDSWAIDQWFPIMPIHRLCEKPTQTAIVADITCDCDGRLDQFLVDGRRQAGLPLHPLGIGEDYFLGVFLVGAYQETLGDLHNLLGDPNVVSVHLEEGRTRCLAQSRGDSLAEVLEYVAYDPPQLVDRFRKLVGNATRAGNITTRQADAMVATYRDGLRGDTYFSCSTTLQTGASDSEPRPAGPHSSRSDPADGRPGRYPRPD
ncbi:MAG: arginine decarboxylase [Planctomycetaceae bacterium]|nr:arginine decarboxylase [Planctomycetaceae bacterium]